MRVLAVVTVVAVLDGEFERFHFFADFDNPPFRAGGLAQFPHITFHMLGGEKDELGLRDGFQVAGLGLEIVGIDARLDVTQHLDSVATDLLRDLGKDGGEARDSNLVGCGDGYDGPKQGEQEQAEKFHGGRMGKYWSDCKQLARSKMEKRP
jgi:hypothetical protein